MHFTPGKDAHILFCGGFVSHMGGTKAMALQRFAEEENWAYTRFDYRGHGESPGKFEDFTLSDWLDDAIHVLDDIQSSKVFIVGSSMGAWIALLLAIRRPERIQGLVLLAAATDFLINLVHQQLDDAQKDTLQREGKILLPSDYDKDAPYPFTQNLLSDSYKHRLLDSPITVSCPVRLIHGLNDEDIPWQTSQATLERLQSEDARLLLIKGADHRLSDASQLTLIRQTLAELICSHASC